MNTNQRVTWGSFCDGWRSCHPPLPFATLRYLTPPSPLKWLEFFSQFNVIVNNKYTIYTAVMKEAQTWSASFSQSIHGWLHLSRSDTKQKPMQCMRLPTGAPTEWQHCYGLQGKPKFEIISCECVPCRDRNHLLSTSTCRPRSADCSPLL